MEIWSDWWDRSSRGKAIVPEPEIEPQEMQQSIAPEPLQEKLATCGGSMVPSPGASQA
jgi:hypothetical protein